KLFGSEQPDSKSFLPLLVICTARTSFRCEFQKLKLFRKLLFQFRQSGESLIECEPFQKLANSDEPQFQSFSRISLDFSPNRLHKRMPVWTAGVKRGGLYGIINGFREIAQFQFLMCPSPQPHGLFISKQSCPGFLQTSLNRGILRV